MPDLYIKPTQHCTAEDCYTYSHTAESCGREQPRRCPCPWDYSDAERAAEERAVVYLIVDGDRNIEESYWDRGTAETELYRLNNLTHAAKRRAAYGNYEWYELIELEPQ